MYVTMKLAKYGVNSPCFNLPFLCFPSLPSLFLALDVPVSHSPDVLSRNGHIAWETHSPNPLHSSQTDTPVKVAKRREIAATTGPSTVSRRSIVATKGVTGQQNLTRVSSASSLPPPSPPPTLLDGNLRPTNDANETVCTCELCILPILILVFLVERC